MKTPKVIYDEQNIQPIFAGALKSGGTIENEPLVLELVFICQPFQKVKTDLELLMEFEKYDKVKLVMSKECDTIGEIQEYFDILYVIYW